MAKLYTASLALADTGPADAPAWLAHLSVIVRTEHHKLRQQSDHKWLDWTEHRRQSAVYITRRLTCPFPLGVAYYRLGCPQKGHRGDEH